MDFVIKFLFNINVYSLLKMFFNVKFSFDLYCKSSAMSYSVALTLLSPNLRPLPIDCRFLILLLDGLAKIILCKFLILIPVEKVP